MLVSQFAIPVLRFLGKSVLLNLLHSVDVEAMPFFKTRAMKTEINTRTTYVPGAVHSLFPSPEAQEAGEAALRGGEGGTASLTVGRPRSRDASRGPAPGPYSLQSPSLISSARRRWPRRSSRIGLGGPAARPTCQPPRPVCVNPRA